MKKIVDIFLDYTPIQKAVSVTVLTAGCIIGYFFILSPTCSSLSATSKSYESHNSLKIQYQNIQSDSKFKSKKIRHMLDTQKANKEYIFSSAQADDFLTQFRHELTSQDCLIESIELSDSVLIPILQQSDKTGNFGFWKATVLASGTFEKWIFILDWLEKYPQEILVNSLQLKTSESDSSILNISIEIVLPVMDEIK